MKDKPYKYNWLTYIIIAFISAITPYSIHLYLENNKLEALVESTNKKIDMLYVLSSNNNIQPLKAVLDTQYKDNLVLNQLSNNTSIILALLAIFITAGGILSFKKFDEKIYSLKKNLAKNKSNLQETKIILEATSLIIKRQVYDNHSLKLLELYSFKTANAPGDLEKLSQLGIKTLCHFMISYMDLLENIKTSQNLNKINIYLESTNVHMPFIEKNLSKNFNKQYAIIHNIFIDNLSVLEHKFYKDLIKVLKNYLDKDFNSTTCVKIEELLFEIEKLKI
ncbi:hypothetical protein [Myroides marinus]|uniref:hypothetical protein n=1 Tax=Myroides marinus TaxID=703342 RepID=UPI002578DC66|nr:hypothetical protein [Myroides marinus]MDM1345727.1 hypothetical protein [Myroides marinus]MDM1378793.1 hypothetical protein [Myroides marinus]MDM1386064.1 hypothetical protein [Myroides marinus]MDM1393277.1 hypothetical protein [Myroides marinus]